MEEEFELKFCRQLAAPPQAVFRAWTRLDQVKEWLTCGAGHTAVVERWDGRRGGRLRVLLSSPTGETHGELDGAFLTVEPDQLVEYEWGPGVVRAEFREAATGTELLVSYAGPGPRGMLQSGWDDALAGLTAHLESTAY